MRSVANWLLNVGLVETFSSPLAIGGAIDVAARRVELVLVHSSAGQSPADQI